MTPFDAPTGARPSRAGLFAMVAVVILGLAGLAFVVVGDDGLPAGDTRTTSGDTTDATTGDTTGDTTAAGPDELDPGSLGAGEVLLEPVGTDLADSFSPSVSIGVEARPTVSLPAVPLPTTTAPLPADQVALPQVAGREPGLYGGTRDAASCDTEQLITFLESDPAKAAAWAGVQGIAVADIRSFVSGLTPVVLTRDTRVTNHGYVDGAARAHPSVLQAGHAVLVDRYGVPRAKCSCGNPLLPPAPLSTGPTYVGPAWPEFTPTAIIVVVATDPVVGGFVVVDLGSGALIVRPVGFGPGMVDTAGEPVDLVEVGNIYGVVPGAASAPGFTVDAPTLITYVFTYHYGSGTPAGQVGLLAADGSFYGPWQTSGTPGQGGVDDANWTVEPLVVIPAGTYTVWDSEPSTWSTNADAGMVGFANVKGIVGVGGAPVPPGTSPATTTTTSPEVATLDQAALTIVDMLLLDCGYDITEWTDGGPVDGGWTWIATTPAGPATFVVHDPLGAFWVDVADQAAADLAVACGFYNP